MSRCESQPYQEGHHVPAERVLHPLGELAVDAKPVKAQNQGAAELNLKQKERSVNWP